MKYGYGNSAYSCTSYGEMRMNQGKKEKRKVSKGRGMCTYIPPKRTNYDLMQELKGAI